MHKANKIAITLARMDANWPKVSTDQAGAVLAAHRLARLLRRQAQEALAGVGLTFTEFELLAALRTHEPPHRLAPSDLYDALLISSGGTTKLLKGLQARSLVRRPANEGDGRSRPVELTDEGRELTERAMRAVQAADRPAMEAMQAAWPGKGSIGKALSELAFAAECAEPVGIASGDNETGS